jgi:hypothetical protein
LAAAALLLAPALTLAATPPVISLPASVTGTQSQVPFSGPVGPTYSTFTVTAPATGIISAGSAMNPYNVWCGNPYGYIQGIPENYVPYSSYDPALYALKNMGTQTQWQQVNWLLNNKKGASGTLNPSITDIQFVIYDLLINNYDTSSLSTDGSQLLADAQASSGFIPSPGQIVAIVLYSAGINVNDGPTSIQDLILEYTLPSTPQTPGISIKKSANVSTAKCSDQVTYSYVVTNTGNTVLTNISVIDDNATPSYAGDDFVVASNVTLQPGQSQTFTRTVMLPVTHNDNNGYSHLLVTKVLPTGDIQVTFLEDSSLIDNSYGQASSPDWGSYGNSLLNHIGQDSAEFQFVDGAGNVILDFAADYLSFSNKYPSGFGTAGVNGGAGHLYAGNSSNILSINTTMTDNMNAPGNVGSWYLQSPAPGAANWKFQCGYTVVVKASCFGKNGFGGCTVKNIQHTRCKGGNWYQCQPTPICGNVTNTATVTASALINGVVQSVTASAKATVALNAGQCQPTPPCKCICWNCQHGDHQHCSNSQCHDTNCSHNQQPPTQCNPTPHWQPCTQANWSKQCNQKQKSGSWGW